MDRATRSPHRADTAYPPSLASHEASNGRPQAPDSPPRKSATKQTS
jgi:hypothetical protein